ncbi:hypothetical protein TNCV_1142841 [Trichonephila clavipes]|nr:hypothetical protein TNCV_1142841 [Trichonephila clavipes]
MNITSLEQSCRKGSPITPNHTYAIGRGVTENIRAPFKVRFWALSQILQRVCTWCQSSFGPPKILPPLCGDIRYATGYRSKTRHLSRTVPVCELP